MNTANITARVLAAMERFDNSSGNYDQWEVTAFLSTLLEALAEIDRLRTYADEPLTTPGTIIQDDVATQQRWHPLYPERG